MDVLVGYATVHGSTREIAERLAGVLRRAGVEAEARQMGQVDDLSGYRAFVLGSAVHGQKWLGPALAFVRENPDTLAARPVWVFSVGMPGALRGPWKGLAPKEIPVIEEGLAGLPRREHRLFSGVVAPWQLNRLGRLLFRLVGGRFGDYRDWAAIESWAVEIAEALSAE
ncbi:flavodoxin domain-containing protein [Streptomyces durbertensis]|uniref:Flavodoxin domain-containing protein n=1 Tax=Streptomyces durbertensis TaxID=2448886 RepID=A0ABR6ELF6_9ACTN|nr:flavodoxin domain-containing protein [Streptomyces durbertensis]MBB1246155.1 flavodoxin domain-containing protein [Streptomyces durbertensis]